MSSAVTFWMAMILNPRIQAKAQGELDAVVGKDRLPTISDRPQLPYIRSIMAEVFRWGPTIPLGWLFYPRVFSTLKKILLRYPSRG